MKTTLSTLRTALEAIETQAALTARTFPNAPGRGDWLTVGRIAREALAATRPPDTRKQWHTVTADWLPVGVNVSETLDRLGHRLGMHAPKPPSSLRVNKLRGYGGKAPGHWLRAYGKRAEIETAIRADYAAT